MVWILVSGTRHATRDKHAVVLQDALKQLAGVKNDTHDVNIVTGDAAGIDSIAAYLCRQKGWNHFKFAAQWSLYGKSAGPRRNQRMIDARGDQLDVVLAFPAAADKDSSGTMDLFNRALALKSKRTDLKLFVIPIHV
jgi:hypothetical protein